jgi:anaerobic selenocysteine-containing dehydrogenase
MIDYSRRAFLKTAGLAGAGMAAGGSLLAQKAEKLRRKVKITDVKCMIVRGTWDWNLIKIETDSGL